VSTSPIGDDPDGADRQAYASIAQDEHMTYPDYLDYHSEWARQNAISLRPSFMLIGRDGKVVTRVTAVLFQSAPEFQQLSTAIEQSLAAH
jgi:hypothetical protein